jgi:hypothetical protein
LQSGFFARLRHSRRDFILDKTFLKVATSKRGAVAAKYVAGKEKARTPIGGAYPQGGKPVFREHRIFFSTAESALSC